MRRSITDTSLFSSLLGTGLGLLEVTWSDHVVLSTTASRSNNSAVEVPKSTIVRSRGGDKLQLHF